METPVTVLLVEDHELLRRALVAGLSRSGFRVVATGDAAEALALFDAERPAVAVIDVGLHLVTGQDLVRALKRLETEPLPVVWITGYPDRAEALRRAGQVALDKPFSLRALVEAVRAQLAERRRRRAT